MSSPAPPAAGVAKIRALAPDDLGAIRQMLSQRDGREWDERSTRWFLHNLDPARCLAWGAFVGDKPVGLTSTFLRTLTVRGDAQRVGSVERIGAADTARRDRQPGLQLRRHAAALKSTPHRAACAYDCATPACGPCNAWQRIFVPMVVY